MKYKKRNVRWMLVVYDLLVYELSAVLLLGLYGGNDKLSISGMMQQMVLALLCVFSIRLIGNVYGQIWRYGGNPVLYSIAIYRCNSIFCLFDLRTDSSS